MPASSDRIVPGGYEWTWWEGRVPDGFRESQSGDRTVDREDIGFLDILHKYNRYGAE